MALSRHWRRHAGAGGEGPDNQLEGRGGGGEGEAQHDKQHDKGAVAFWGDMVVHWMVLLGGGRLCNEQRARRQQHVGGH